MLTSINCLPCFVKHCCDITKRATDDPAVIEKIMRGVLSELAKQDLAQSPPEIVQKLHKIVKETTGINDFFSAEKSYFNKMMLDLEPALDAEIRASSDPLLAAVKFAIAGNVIDFGVYHTLSDQQVLDALHEAVAHEFTTEYDRFRDDLLKAKTIFYIADNAGEIVLDKLLIRQIIDLKGADGITLAVRGYPTLNDVTREDADLVGLTEMVQIVDNGFDAPGTVLHQAGKEYREKFDSADMIIAKGQGNFETLSAEAGNIYFLLKAKCPAIADNIGVAVGTLILKHINER